MTAYIEFNGTRSDTLGLRIINKVEHESTGHDIDTVAVPGRDGELLLSNGRLKSVEKSFPLRLESKNNLTKSQEEISHWLNVEGYRKLLLSWDPEFEYRAAFIKTFSIDEILRNFGNLKVNFLVHPIKYYKEGLVSKRITSGTILVGKGNICAKPIIKMIGSGDCVLTINGRTTKLKDIQEGITLDMQTNTIYQGAQGAWDKFVRSPESVKPFLDEGNNMISWTGNFTVDLTPFWGVKL